MANCFSSDQTDENIQVQVLKALLSIVSSGYIRVHDESLLMAVRTCYNIYLATRNVNYQATAKATLSQILNCIYNRMEQVCAEAAAEKLKAIQDRELQKQQLELANGDAGRDNLCKKLPRGCLIIIWTGLNIKIGIVQKVYE